ncbi:hypothetical protein VMCG_10899 [Cytospora schulzeri]|uniref:Acyl-CoA desaturase n=1 Tax=Cytospora schulzeri TaxID=448051 RepID=A0A423V7U0_9PEZI|nr:hypothetical protein VMCG_10899 [Valsa malicola]
MSDNVKVKSAFNAKGPHISELPFTWQNWHQHINWLNTFFVVFVPLMGFVGAYWTPLRLSTAIFSVFYYAITGIGITAGYHRLWAHSCYKASTPLKIYLAAVGAGAIQGSIRTWSRDHRAHHRFTDTEKDPYSIRKGFWYSHMGWVVFNQDYKKVGRCDITDLNQVRNFGTGHFTNTCSLASWILSHLSSHIQSYRMLMSSSQDPIVMWQHRNMVYAIVAMAWVFPTAVCGLLWGDWQGGFIYAGILRCLVVQQATFCVNSLAHWLGEQPFDDRRSPRDHVLTALVTLGEGYHNFHHEFPSDYRNAIEWWQYDPTKWTIWVWKQLGLAEDLKRFRQNEIEKGRVQQLQKALDRRRNRLDWGIPLVDLPIMSWDEYVSEAKSENGRALVSIAGVIHDVTDFIKDHPGGKAFILMAIGKDATAIFNGGVYEHSNAAHNLLSTMRVGVLRGGCEVEVWKHAATDSR